MSETLHFKLKIWKQKGASDPGRFETYEVHDIPADISFLEMLDVLNEHLIQGGQAPVAFDNDCREGVCGMCSLVINGQAHGPNRGTTACQLYMRSFKNGETITIEPFRARAFPAVKDLVVDRSAFDRIIMAGGYVSVSVGAAPDGNSVLIPSDMAEAAIDAAACIGCGACVAACPNASAMLFTSAKISHLGFLPQGQPERERRARLIQQAMDNEGFGGCTNIGECEAACPKKISVKHISRFNRDSLLAMLLTELKPEE